MDDFNVYDFNEIFNNIEILQNEDIKKLYIKRIEILDQKINLLNSLDEKT
jgi:hypothetical protein